MSVFTAIVHTTPSAIGILQLLDLWNSLPSELRQRDSLREFKRLLKTYLFGDHGAFQRLIHEDERLHSGHLSHSFIRNT